MKTYVFEFPLDYGVRRVLVEDERDQGAEVCMELVKLRYRLPKSTQVKFIGTL